MTRGDRVAPIRVSATIADVTNFQSAGLMLILLPDARPPDAIPKTCQVPRTTP